jgi:D-3-phosphoglycerate dehydrogenase
VKAPRVLVLEPTRHTDTVCEVLGPEASVVRGPISRTELMARVSEFDAVFARLGHRLDAEVLSQGGQLRVIATPTTGLTHIDVDAARIAGVDILSLRGEDTLLEGLPATAELTWGLLLAVARKMVAASRHTEAGGWNRDQFWSRELAGKIFGILGCGRVGRQVAAYGAAFGMDVIAYDMSVANVEQTSAREVDKQTLLSTADVISIHAKYDQGDPFLLNASDFDRIKSGSILLNTARGELIDEAALIRSLRSGRLSGAGLDVLRDEPHVNTEMLQLQQTHNVVITPHIGGATHESIMKTELFMARKLRAYLESADAQKG